jgi:hypothetical protein
MLDSKVETIVSLTDKMVKSSKRSVERLRKEAKDLNDQLITLTSVIDKTNALKEKILKDPKKFNGPHGDLEDILNKTKQAIRAINLELLKNKDVTDSLLTTYQTSLEMLIES